MEFSLLEHNLLHTIFIFHLTLKYPIAMRIYINMCSKLNLKVKLEVYPRVG